MDCRPSGHYPVVSQNWTSLKFVGFAQFQLLARGHFTPQFVKEVLDHADETHIHDEWTKKKFDERKYKSSEIYGSPKDPKLQEEYREYLKKRLDEIQKQRGSK